MKQFEVQLAFEELRSQFDKWKKAFNDVAREFDKIMTRLIHEAVANRMSVEQIASATGLSPKVVRMKMRRMGFDPKRGRGPLAHAAAEALRTNAELLGVDPLDIDLTSPLAYLPGGSQLQAAAQSEAVKGVKDVQCEAVSPESSQPCALPEGHEESHASERVNGVRAVWA